MTHVTGKNLRSFVAVACMIRPGFLDSESRQDLIELARDGAAAHRLARRANALVLLDDGMSCEAIARVLLIDDDTIRTWHRLYQDDGIEGLASFGYEGGACRLTAGLARSGCRIQLHFIPSYCPHLDPIERLWGLMHRHCTHNKCYAGFKDFSRAVLSFLREKVPRNWHVYCDQVTDNFRVIDPADCRVLA